MKPRQRFRIVEFLNRTGTTSWRVTGMRANGERIRENFANPKDAQCRQIALESEFFTAPQDTALRATKLTDSQIHLAEAAFNKLLGGGNKAEEADILRAVDNWLTQERPKLAAESPLLDDAVKLFGEWLDATRELRDLSKRNLRIRVNIFAGSVGNHRIADITTEHIEKFLDGRKASAATRDNDKRAVSRFFSWCIERPRRWLKFNPCREIKIAKGEKQPPTILTVDECAKLLRAAEMFKGGALAPYVAVCLFAGVRPEGEAKRLTWESVNLADKEMRLEGKTKAVRVFEIVPMLRNGNSTHAGPDTLLRWLCAYKDKPFHSPNWRRDFGKLKEAIGYGTPTKKNPTLRPWPVDVMRHTAISHYLRLTGSYGQTAEQFGNSEAMIKKHYQGRVSSEDTKKFYAIMPKRGAMK